MVPVEGQPRKRLEARWGADHDVRSGASCACDERTPKLPNERSVETDSPTDLERPCAREPRLEQTVPSSVAPASRTKREKQGCRKGAWPRVFFRKSVSSGRV